MFREGDIVEHILSKDWLLVLDINSDNNMILCRTKTHEAIWFHEFELRRK
jgi:mRNA-degrading endonuclease YafQ of YafQ-DinJ toxin-antitoxin module